jgi:hypothetical protein
MSRFAVVVVTREETHVIWEEERACAEVTFDVAKASLKSVLDVRLVEVLKSAQGLAAERVPEQLSFNFPKRVEL